MGVQTSHDELQWCPDQTAGETPGGDPVEAVGGRLQWCPDQTAGETPDASGCLPRQSGFNGAPTKRPGKLRG